MGKRTRKGKGVLWLIAFLLVLVIVIGGYIAFTTVETDVEPTTDNGNGGGTSLIDAPNGMCPTDGKSTINVKVYDDYASTTTHLASIQLYARNTATDIIENNTSSSASAWATMDVSCNKNYEVFAVTLADTSGSAVSAVITADEDQEYVKLHTNTLSYLVTRVRDVDNDDWEYLYPDDLASGPNATTFSEANSTRIYDDNNAGDIAIGADGTLSLEIPIKAYDNRKSVSDKGEIDLTDTRMDLRTILCVDVGTDDEWDADTISVNIGSGPELENLLDTPGSIDAESAKYSYIKNAEGCYELGDIDKTPRTLWLQMDAESGQDPDTSNDDVSLYFISEGTYRSNKDNDNILTGFYTDASTRLPVVYSNRIPLMVIQIS